MARKSKAAEVKDEEDAVIAQAMAIIDGRLARGQSLACPEAAGTYCKLRLSHREREVFCVMYLDTKHRVVAFEEMFYGTIDSAEVHPREVAKRALHHNAAAVILAHNHPSGSPEASPADRAVTARLKQALALLDVRLLDHFIVGDGKPTSMAQLGWV